MAHSFKHTLQLLAPHLLTLNLSTNELGAKHLAALIVPALRTRPSASAAAEEEGKALGAVRLTDLDLRCVCVFAVRPIACMTCAFLLCVVCGA